MPRLGTARSGAACFPSQPAERRELQQPPHWPALSLLLWGRQPGPAPTAVVGPHRPAISAVLLQAASALGAAPAGADHAADGGAVAGAEALHPGAHFGDDAHYLVPCRAGCEGQGAG